MYPEVPFPEWIVFLENLFKRLLIRGLIATGFFLAGLHLAANSIEASGMASPRNPAWRVIRGLLAIEYEIMRLILFGGLLLGCLVVIAYAAIFFIFEPRQKRREKIEKAIRDEEARIREAEVSERWRKGREEDERRFRKWVDDTTEQERIRRAKETARLNARTPEQVKADAIHEITKGW